MDRFFLRFVAVTLAVCVVVMVGYRLFFFTPTVQKDDVVVPETYIWKTVVLFDEHVRATADLPSESFAIMERAYQWTLPDAYLEKSRSMKLELFTQNTVFDATGCFVSNDIEHVTGGLTVAINGEAYCVVTGVSVGAGNVYRTTTYTKKDHTDPFAFSFSIHYVGDVHIYGGCETEEDAQKPECVAREFHVDQDTKLFGDIMETLHVEAK